MANTELTRCLRDAGFSEEVIAAKLDGLDHDGIVDQDDEAEWPEVETDDIFELFAEERFSGDESDIW